MEAAASTRRLAAIVCMDVAGYSRLMGADEKGTLARLKAIRREIIEPAIAAHGGTLVKTTGDGFLVEFPSVVEATQCTVEIQAEMARRSDAETPDRRLTLRAGIHLGDVIADNGDLYGDGVNVAARIEQIAEPGAVFLSRSARDQVRDRLPYLIEDQGEHQVKNINRPVRIFRVAFDPETVAGVVQPVLQSSLKPFWKWFSRRWGVAAVLPLIAILLGAWFWFRPLEKAIEPRPQATVTLPLPDRPSLAVLPLKNVSGDPEQEYFADGITEDVITDLAKVSGLFVIARNSTFAYKGRSPTVRQVAEDLGVRYILDGSIRRAEDTIRVNVQLVDGTTGGQVWADRYNGPFRELFSFQDHVTRQIVGALETNVPGLAASVRSAVQTSNLTAYDMFLKGWAHYRLGTLDDLGKAISYFEKAITHDSDYARAHAALAAVFSALLDRNRATGTNLWSERLGFWHDDAVERERRHLEMALKTPDPLAHQVASTRAIRQARHRDAMAQAGSALALNPNDPIGHKAMAAALIYAGRPADAADHILRAMRLDPQFTHEYLYWLGLAQFGMGRFAEAVDTLGRATQSNPDDDVGLIVLAAAYGHLGRSQEGAAAIGRANELRLKRNQQLSRGPLVAGIDLQLVGTYSLKDLETWPFAIAADRERLRQGLRLAGVPETGEEQQVSPQEVPGAITVDAAAAKALFDRGVPFIDVRGEATWRDGHIARALNLDVKTLTEEALSRVTGKEGEIVIYCGGPRCLMSSEASKKAAAWGFRRVYYFREGFPAWRNAGYPVTVP